MVIGGQAFRHQTSDVPSIPPRLLYNLVRGPMEVESINIGRVDAASGRCNEWSRIRRLDLLFREPHTRSEVRRRLRLFKTWQRAVADQPAIRHQRLSVRVNLS